MIVQAIVAKLSADPRVQRTLAPWDFGDGVKRPAIHVRDPAPPNCGAPLIVLTQESSDDEGATRDSQGGTVSLTATVWGDLAGSEKALRAAALTVWNLLDRCTLTLAGPWECSFMAASAPGKITDRHGFPGYVVPVRVRFTAKEV